MTVKRYECKVMTPVARLQVTVFTNNQGEVEELARLKAAKVFKRLQGITAHNISVIDIRDCGQSDGAVDSFTPTLVLGR